MKVSVIDCSVSGHRETYYKTFARTWAELGHEVLLIAPRRPDTAEATAFRPIATRPLLPLPVGKPLRKKAVVLQNAWIRWQNLSSIGKQLKDFHPDLVYFPCLDDLLPTLGPSAAMSRVLPYPWSGLLVQSALPPYKPWQPDVRPFLRNPLCRGIGVLNEYSADSLKPFQPRIASLPDFADLSLPDTSYPLLHTLRRRAAGRKIISLLGSLGERKGIRLLLDTIPLLPPSDYFFLMAGRPWLTDGQTRTVRAFEATHPNCLFSLNQIPDEACFNALVEASDVIFAAYRRFTGSSNLLTKAAAFRRPILVSQGECMGRRVKEYGTGLAVPETEAKACSEALVRLCRTGAPDISGFRRYAEKHSLERLKEELDKVSHSLPSHLPV